MSRKKIILIIVGVLILIGLIAGFYYWLQYLKPEGEVSIFPEEKTEILKEISRQEAIELALEKYPGEVLSVDKKTFEAEKESEENQDFWVIAIDLAVSIEEPSASDQTKETDRVWIRVNVNTKELSIYKLGD